MATFFVVAVPLFLVNGSITWAINDSGLYNRGFEKYSISLYTGITDADLRQAGADIRHYFNSGDEPLAVRTQIFGEERDIFNQREVVHMRDVKGLIRGVYLFAGGALAYIIAVAIGGFAGFGRAFAVQLAQFLLWGGLLTLGLLVLFGLFAVVGFDSLFLKFHQLSFSNDFWQLDPSRDYLIIMFPFGFWFDATMRVVAAAVLGAISLSGVSGGYLLYRRWAVGKGSGGSHPAHNV
ncbi:MAG: TIGR01906 family membrane protein [Chloroflexi bacterium]|nr:TIGR01906 family membrane protein [Chloroflexota bacterium]MDA1218823.1 TIGR01906 family membrane protein [Chloroflexota bacterium]